MSALRHSLPIILLQLYMLCVLPPAAAKVTALIVFGDSTVDTGNNNYISTLVKSDFAPYGRDLRPPGSGSGGQPTGRFSNGRLAVDFISEAFGLPPLVPAYLDPNVNMSSLATGACFASAGAGYDNATSDLFVRKTPSCSCTKNRFFVTTPLNAASDKHVDPFCSPFCRCGKSWTTSKSTRRS